MKPAFLMALFLSMFLVGCGGDNAPVNEVNGIAKDKPIPPPKKDK